MEKDEYLIGSCKYKKEPVGVDELNLLKECTDFLEREGNIIFIFFYRWIYIRTERTGKERRGDFAYSEKI